VENVMEQTRAHVNCFKKNRYADYVQIITMTSGLSDFDFTAHIANIRWLRARALFGGVTRG